MGAADAGTVWRRMGKRRAAAHKCAPPGPCFHPDRARLVIMSMDLCLQVWKRTWRQGHRLPRWGAELVLPCPPSQGPEQQRSARRPRRPPTEPVVDQVEWVADDSMCVALTPAQPALTPACALVLVVCLDQGNSACSQLAGRPTGWVAPHSAGLRACAGACLQAGGVRLPRFHPARLLDAVWQAAALPCRPSGEIHSARGRHSPRGTVQLAFGPRTLTLAPHPACFWFWGRLGVGHAHPGTCLL